MIGGGGGGGGGASSRNQKNGAQFYGQSAPAAALQPVMPESHSQLETTAAVSLVFASTSSILFGW